MAGGKQQKLCPVCIGKGKKYVPKGLWKIQVGNLLKGLPEEGWFEAACGDGSKGPRVYDWMLLEAEISEAGWSRHLLVCRSKTKPEEL